MINCGALFPIIAKLGKKYYFNKKLCNSVAINWGFFIPISEDWNKIKREIINPNFRRLE